MDKLERKELAISGIKSLLSNIPFAGQALSEVIFEFRGRIKQERLNHFVTLLSEYFSSASEEELSNITTEDFSDLFEGVILRVLRTKSTEKHKRFRDILRNQLLGNIKLDNAETYLDLISSLSEMEIEVLRQHQAFDDDYTMFKKKHKELQQTIFQKSEIRQKKADQSKGSEFDLLTLEIEKLEEERQKIKINIDNKEIFRQASYYQLSEADFTFCKQSLASKALLIDKGVGAINTPPFLLMHITEFGKDFIKFILAD